MTGAATSVSASLATGPGGGRATGAASVSASLATGPGGGRATGAASVPVGLDTGAGGAGSRRGRCAAVVGTALTVLAVGCGGADRPAAGDADPTVAAAVAPGTADEAPGSVSDSPSEPGVRADAARPSPSDSAGRAYGALPSTATPEDWRIVREKLEWARAQRLDTLPLDQVVARIGASFVGTDYVPRTLEVPGPERLVVNLRQLDCVTFVENVLVLSRLAVDGQALGDGTGAGLPVRFEALLTEVRYRNGVIDGYPSRLHYFSEWIADAEAKGLVRDVTGDLGGVEDPEPIRFMSRHPDAYRQLADPATLGAIRDVEERLDGRRRLYVPEDRIAERAARIRDGDIIAATSTAEGLDVAHTGIALWRDGRLHLLHAPLVGRSVEISERPLAERILGFGGQDGIMVARPVDPRAGPAGTER